MLADRKTTMGFATGRLVLTDILTSIPPVLPGLRRLHPFLFSGQFRTAWKSFAHLWPEMAEAQDNTGRFNGGK